MAGSSKLLTSLVVQRAENEEVFPTLYLAALAQVGARGARGVEAGAVGVQSGRVGAKAAKEGCLASGKAVRVLVRS